MKTVLAGAVLIVALAGCQQWQSTAPFADKLSSVSGSTTAQMQADTLAAITCRDHAPAAHCAQSIY